MEKTYCIFVGATQRVTIYTLVIVPSIRVGIPKKAIGMRNGLVLSTDSLHAGFQILWWLLICKIYVSIGYRGRQWIRP